MKHPVPESNLEFGKKLRTLRLLNEMSQQELAEHLNVSFQQVQKYENGKNRISLEKLVEICEIFDVSTDFFFNADEKDRKFLKLVFDSEAEQLLRYWSKIDSPKMKRDILQFIKRLSKYTN